MSPDPSAIGGRATTGFDYRYAGHGFLQKERSMPTQAADMLAWHANKNFIRHEAGKIEPRGDFKALLDGVVTGQYKLTPGNLQALNRIIEDRTGGHPKGHMLTKYALRGDKRFFSDPEAVFQLIASQRGR